MVRGKPHSDWIRLTFGEMVMNVAERVEPAPGDETTYVGLEHLDSGSLVVSRWGLDVPLVGTKLRMIKGDVLFARRNAYLRRVSVAPHDGLFSAHGLVLRARRNVMDPSFLPLFMQSDAFMERANTISVGSLSPTINWSTLAKEVFAIPPIEEQLRFARILLATHRTRERYRISLKALQRGRDAFVDSICSGELSAYPSTRLADFSDICYGLTISPERRLAKKKKVPYLRVANVLRGSVDLSEVKKTNELDGDAKYRLQAGDVLIVEGHANPLEIGRACVWTEQLSDALHQNHIIRARCHESAFPHFLCVMMNSSQGRRYFRSHAKSSSGLNTINSTVVKNYTIPLPPRAIQRSLLDQIHVFDVSACQLLDRQTKLDRVSKATFDILDGQQSRNDETLRA